jgi:hypothetical protein
MHAIAIAADPQTIAALRANPNDVAAGLRASEELAEWEHISLGQAETQVIDVVSHVSPRALAALLSRNGGR